MELLSRPFNGRNYWKKNGYTLLNGAAPSNRKIEVVHIDGKAKGKRSFWRLRKARRVLVRLSPIRLLAKLRDGYINMMLRVAGDVGRLNGGSDFLGKRIPRARKVKAPGKKRKEEFENRLVLEIYKAIATSRGISEL